MKNYEPTPNRNSTIQQDKSLNNTMNRPITESNGWDKLKSPLILKQNTHESKHKKNKNNKSTNNKFLTVAQGDTGLFGVNTVQYTFIPNFTFRGQTYQAANIRVCRCSAAARSTTRRRRWTLGRHLLLLLLITE